METLASYSLSDLLLFSDRVYRRMFILHNETWWPLQAVTLASGLFVLWNIARPSRLGLRIACAALAAMWAFVAWAFFWERYATINWAAPYLTPAFALQAALLAALALRPLSVAAGQERISVARVLATLVGATALAGYPLITGLGTGSWRGAEVVGLTPDPTALLTLALLSVTPGAIAGLGWIIPILWVVKTGLTLWTLEVAWALLAPLTGLTLLIVRRSNYARRRLA